MALITGRVWCRRNRMPIRITPVAFTFTSVPTIAFFNHCLTHWIDTAVCTDAHVAFIKHLFRNLFGLPMDTALVGIAFDADQTLAMFSFDDCQTFFAVKRKLQSFEAFIAQADGFNVHWNLSMGFIEGLHMAESTLVANECDGPEEER